MTAVLACGGDLHLGGAVRTRADRASSSAVVLSHGSAAGLLGIGPEPGGRIEISTMLPTDRTVPGIGLHRRPTLRGDSIGHYQGIPVTSPVQTLIDLAARHEQVTVERFVNEADRLGLVRTDHLRGALDAHAGERGVGRLRAILDRRTFRYTRSELERDFLPLAHQAGLSLPRTSVYVDGHEVDFHFPDLNLVVETDGGTYHRTPAEQTKDRERDQDHFAAGVAQLRFTHAQVKFEPARVVRILRSAAIIPS